ncbi:very long chain fatty acid elongase 2-like [Liolophura sinensis]|uniref:very long chain fatty acid elongase 2-like n=1 Tax=Liolophura sinensis TaxID=3198878 RepID=UPI003158988A
MVSAWVKDLVDQYERALPQADPRSRNWLLLCNSPIPVWVLTAVYLGFVAIGPRVMKDRQPLKMSTFLVVYNLGLVFLSVYMFVEIILSAYDAGYDFFCAKYNKDSWTNPRETRVARVLWWYFFSKAIELLDTVLMILRKKNNQVTFLHVFHHASMLNIWWWVMMFIPGGLSYFGSCLNCLVHVAMYTYYGLSAIPSLREKLWWKKYITKFQLIQFVITFSHTAYSLTLSCDFPRWGQYLLSSYMVAMVILFGNFYIQTYRRSRRLAHKDSKSAVNNGTTPGANGIKEHKNGGSHLKGDTNGYLRNRVKEQ